MPAPMTPTPLLAESQKARGFRRPIWLAALVVSAVIVTVVSVFGLLAGPLRDTGVGRLAHGDISGQDAEGLCAGFADDHMPGAKSAGFENVTRRFDGNLHNWIVSGEVAAGGAHGSFSCTLEWTAGGSAVYLKEISLPNGYKSKMES